MSKAVDTKSSVILIGRLTNGERTSLKRVRLACAFIAALLFLVVPELAQAFEQKYEFRIEQETLGSALDAIVQQTDLVILYPYELAGKTGVNPVIGRYSVREALEILLRDTQFSGGLTEGGVMFVSLSGVGKAQGREGQVNSGKIKRGLLASVSSLLLGAAASNSAAAQETASDAAESESLDIIEAITVTAQRRKQNIKDVPQSVFALDDLQLRRQRIENFDDLGLAVPGLSVIDFGNIGQQRIYMRGLGNLVGDSLVGVYLDDTSTVTSAVDQLNFRTYDLERVEVLRGPQGTIYGQGSVGGAIRFITKNPELSAFAGRVDVSASFTEEGAPSQDVKAVLNIPIVKDRFAIRVSGVFENAGGWVDQPLAQKENINDHTLTSVRAKILFQPTDAFELLGTFALFRLDGGLAGTDGLGNIENSQFQQVFGLLSTPSRGEDYEIYSLKGSYDFGSVNLVGITSYVELKNTVRNVPGGPNGWDYETDFLQDVDRLGSIFTQEIRLSSDHDGGIHWHLGGIYSDVESGGGFKFDFGPTVGPIEGTFVRNRDPVVKDALSESWAVFGEGSYELGERLELGAGFRYFENEKTDTRRSQNATFSTFSPRAFAKYQLTDTVNIYFNVGKGFRSGGFSRDNIYDPESTWSYDLGSKGFMFDGLIDYDVAIFYSRIKNFQIVSAVQGSPVPLIENGGEAEIKGIEWNIGLQLTDQLHFNVHGTYLDPILDESAFSGQPIGVGDQLNLVPKYHFGFDASYNFFLAERPGTFTLVYNRRDRIFLTARDSFFSHFSKSGIIDMLNLSIHWDYSDSVTLGLFASNLLNEADSPVPLGDNTVFRDTVSGSGLVGKGAAGSLPPRPRTYGVSIGVEF